LLNYIPRQNSANIIGGLRDDALIYKINESTAIVQTVDFITPVVNDPYTFGAIAAANALSDIYAKGAVPVVALNIVGYPAKSLPLNYLGEILRGGAAKAAEAGVIVGGGHSIEDQAPKYGMAVTGIVDINKPVLKTGARAGDALILTKPLGSGIITTGIDRNLVNGETEQKISDIMAQLNKQASEAMMQVGVNACTDISGFGLLGHLHEMLLAGNKSACIRLKDVPVVEETWDLVSAGAVPGGTHSNYRHLQQFVDWHPGVSREARLILCDAQTSGGLLMSVPPEKVDLMVELLQKGGCYAADIGCIGEDAKGLIRVDR